MDNPLPTIHNSREAVMGNCKKCKQEIISYNVGGPEDV